MGFTEFIKPDINIGFIKYKNVALTISAFFFIASVLFIYFIGFNFGIEFAGGMEIRVHVPEGTTASDISDALKEKGINRAIVLEFPDMQNVFSVKIKGKNVATELAGEKMNDKATNIYKIIEDKFGKENTKSESIDSIGPRVGESLKKKGIYAILFAIIGILIYIGIRFNFKYAPGAVIALIHDVTLTAGIFVIMRHEISLAVIAAFLTIAGYSINDTIIVFDRIREGTSRYRGQKMPEVVNSSINQTLSRTILTSITTMLVVVSLYILGGEILRDFALAMIIGIVVGTYSSIFIASPIFLMLDETFTKRRIKARKRR